MRYKKHNDLIVLQAMLNDSLPVNLILDTGCRNIILFGRRYYNLVKSITPKVVSFSGFGKESPSNARLSMGNSVLLDEIVGKEIVILVASKRNVLLGTRWIDGIIGYDLLYKFEIEVDPERSTITFRPAFHGEVYHNFEYFKLLPDFLLPTVEASIAKEDVVYTMPLLIDTGSQLPLLLKTQELTGNSQRIAYGLSGAILAATPYSKWFAIERTIIQTELNYFATAVPGDDSMSVGMGLLKDHTFILNLSKGFFAIRRRRPIKPNEHQ